MKNILSILLSLILLASHMYLTIGTHYCGGKAVEIKIMLGEAHLSCDMMDMDGPCNDSENPNKNGIAFNKVPCCENKYQTVQSTHEFVKYAAQTTINVEFAVAFFYTSLNLGLFPKSHHQYYSEYYSPPIEKDIQVLFQTFLI